MLNYSIFNSNINRDRTLREDDHENNAMIRLRLKNKLDEVTYIGFLGGERLKNEKEKEISKYYLDMET